MNKLVSIVIPVWNSQEFLEQTIKSALAQTYQPVEIIVVDDGSTDRSLAIAKTFPVIVISQPNQGVAEARNYGARESKGEFLLFLDSDDWIDPTYLEQTVPLMGEDKVGIVATSMQRFGLRNDIAYPSGFSLQHELHSNDLPITSLIRRSAFPGYRKMKLGGYEDWDLWIRILAQGWQVGAVYKPLFHYRVRPNSMIASSHGIERRMKDELIAMNQDLYS